ncbi:hypothetical protein K457DRAFT_138106 [Linnemannia elongata AG-77]|uniref:Uncharacterized protein n=1 Tax=Linnemannia elongata AG-77 TaxID=1314771 RepID=A0A197JXQ3_9FUNG|nr:hypothetical protein K457DRAFT_138106 [Linnemannia elongata AG-77]
MQLLFLLLYPPFLWLSLPLLASTFFIFASPSSSLALPDQQNFGLAHHSFTSAYHSKSRPPLFSCLSIFFAISHILCLGYSIGKRRKGGSMNS